MHRVFICGAFNFPRGGAASNYIQYFGMALRDCGYEVHVVTTRNREYVGAEYKGMIIDAAEYRSGKIRHYLDFKTGAQKVILNELKQFEVGENDIVIVYSHNLWLHEAVQNHCKKNQIRVGAVVVEYFSENDLKKKWEYKKYDKLTKKILPDYDFLFPISTYIEKKLTGGSARQMVLPIMADPFEYEYHEKQFGSTKKFIFPAKGMMKDALENMLLAIGQVLQDQTLNVEFHFCGVKETVLRETLKVSNSESLDRRIVVHGWLEYDELVELYQEMQFLLLAREVNEMTKANFPSKVPELLCYGVIPIASRVGDYTKYYLNDNNSIIIDGCDVKNIYDAIYKTFALSEERMRGLSASARETAEKAFNYRCWRLKLEKFLKDGENATN